MEVTGSSITAGMTASLAAIKQNIAQVNQAAQLIAEGNLDPALFVDIKLGEAGVKANAAVIRSQDELIGILLNTLA